MYTVLDRVCEVQVRMLHHEKHGESLYRTCWCMSCRCASSPAAATQLAEQLPRLAPATLGYSRSTAVQLAALQLANLLLPHMATAAAAAEFALRQVPIYLQHKDVDCRGQFLELLIQAWKLQDADSSQTAGADPNTQQQQQQQQLEAVLFVLACDRSASLRSAAAAFWHTTGNISSGPAAGSPHTVLLPTIPAPRLTALLLKISTLKPHLQQIWDRYGGNMSVSGDSKSVAERLCRDAEQQWPCVAAALLLRLPAAVGSAWESRMFNQNLGSAQFVDYPIQTQVGDSAGTILGGSNHHLLLL